MNANGIDFASIPYRGAKKELASEEGITKMTVNRKLRDGDPVIIKKLYDKCFQKLPDGLKIKLLAEAQDAIGN